MKKVLIFIVLFVALPAQAAKSTKPQKLTNTSGYNQDLKMLEIRAKERTVSYPKGQAGFSITGAATSTQPNLSIRNISVNLAAELSPWVMGFASVGYLRRGLAPELIAPSTIGDTRALVNHVFITIGQLKKSPFYGSVGQMNIPFGEYKTLLVAPALTARLGRMTQRALLLGFKQPNHAYGNFHGSVFGFQSNLRNLDTSHQSNGGVNVGYAFSRKTFKVDAGASYIANIADSTGMQDTRNPFPIFDDVDLGDLLGPEDLGDITAFRGFASSIQDQILDRKVPGVDVRGRIGYNGFSLQGEYTGAIVKFSPDNMTFNEEPARPRAWSTEAAYEFQWFNRKKASIAIGYSRSAEALALRMPKQMYSVGFKTALTKYLSFALGYQRSQNYGIDDEAVVQDNPVLSNSKTRHAYIATLKLSF